MGMLRRNTKATASTLAKIWV